MRPATAAWPPRLIEGGVVRIGDPIGTSLVSLEFDAASSLVFYGSYRCRPDGHPARPTTSSRGLRARGADVELIDAKAVGLPMLDRMYKEYPAGEAPAAMEELAEKIRARRRLRVRHRRIQLGRAARPEEPHRSFSRGMVLAAGGDRQLFGRAVLPACARRIAWHGTLSEMGMVVISSTLAVGADRAGARRRRPADRRRRQGARSEPFRASPTTSPGGPRRRKRSAPGQAAILTARVRRSLSRLPAPADYLRAPHLRPLHSVGRRKHQVDCSEGGLRHEARTDCDHQCDLRVGNANGLRRRRVVHRRRLGRQRHVSGRRQGGELPRHHHEVRRRRRTSRSAKPR